MQSGGGRRCHSRVDGVCAGCGGARGAGEARHCVRHDHLAAEGGGSGRRGGGGGGGCKVWYRESVGKLTAGVGLVGEGVGREGRDRGREGKGEGKGGWGFQEGLDDHLWCGYRTSDRALGMASWATGDAMGVPVWAVCVCGGGGGWRCR